MSRTGLPEAPWVMARDIGWFDYLFRVLKVIDPMRRTRSAVKGSTVNSKSLAMLEIPLPPLIEQVRIVTRIDEFRERLVVLRERLSG
jgi:Type I restriction modification DNA specificity domain